MGVPLNIHNEIFFPVHLSYVDLIIKRAKELKRVEKKFFLPGTNHWEAYDPVCGSCLIAE